MSLINDALKRTQKNTQSQTSPRVDKLELRPTESTSEAPQKRGGGGRTLVWILITVVAVANASLWFAFKHRSPNTQVAARTADPEPVVAPPAPEPPAPKPTEAMPAPAPVTPAVVYEAVAPVSEPRPTVVSQPKTEVSGPEIEVPAPVQVALLPSERSEFKLKSILAHPVRPSAMIGNQILFVGDSVGGYSITKIESHKVTLTRSSDTVVLTLP